MADTCRFIDSANGTVGGRRWDIRCTDGTAGWRCESTGSAVDEAVAAVFLLLERQVRGRGGMA